MIKIKQYKVLLLAVLFVAGGCNEGYIDEITPVSPGPDETPPSITINYPTGNVVIPFTENETDINFRIEVSDDIEIASIQLSLDGTQLVTFNEFKDYRIAIESYLAENMAVGNYTLEITASDLSGKSTTETLDFEVTNKYVTVYDGEIFYMPFEGDVFLELNNDASATVVGTPGFATGLIGNAYAGATDSYLTFPTDGLKNDEFSAVFWMKVNAVPDRAGILVMGPPDVDNANYPTSQNLRTSGFRFFRENAGGMQRFKLNAGNGAADSWFDGGTAADVDPTSGAWVHFAFTISSTEAVVYINGEVVKQGDFTGIDWTGCDVLSIMSGAPRFTGWNHWSDESLMDELRIFNKALTQTEIQAIFGNESPSS